MTSRPIVVRLATITAALLSAACGSGMLDVGYPTASSIGGGGGAGASVAVYSGVMADSTKRGQLSITVNTTLVVSGTMTFSGGPTVTVAGSIDTVAQRVTATGGGYSVVAYPSQGTLQGTYSGPAGTSTGYLVATSDTLTQLTHSTYCGTYVSTNGNGWIGMVVLSDGEVGGFAVQTAGLAASQSFTGSVLNGTIFSAVTSQSAPLAGTAAIGSITGSYSPAIGNTAGTGTFSATTGGC